MRPAGKGALESLYFDYPRFAARRVPELDGAVTRHPVLIVGAGPIGMTAALVLARYGIRSVLIDRKDTFNDGSRAICIARPSMHILERIGAVAPFVEKALGWRFGRSYYRGEQIFRLEMPQPPGEKYLPMYNLQQQYIEKFLHDAVAANDLIDMRWQSELSGLEPHNDGVSVRISSPAGDYRLDADYVLAADGARSPVRSMLGLAAEGRQLRRPLCDRGYPHGSRFSDRAPRLFRTGRQSRRHGADSQAAGRYLARGLPAPRRRERGRCPERGKHPRARRRDPCRYRPHKTVGAGMVERLFRQHAVPRRLPARPRLLHRRCRAYRADLRRARAEQWPRGCREHRLEAGARAPWRGGRAAARQLFAGAARRHARRLCQCHQEHALHDAADARLAVGARGGAVAQSCATNFREGSPTRGRCSLIPIRKVH